MADFEAPTDLLNNRGLIADPEAFAREKGAASWLYLCGEEFAAMAELRAWVADGLEQLS
jgi:hypothetical protein